MRLKSTKADHETESALLQFLLPIARLLVTGGTGIDKLERAAKRAYLRAAMEAVLPRGQRVNISLLSVATGMTRKEVSMLLRDSRDDRKAATKNRGEQRALRVLRGWLTDPRFQNRSANVDALPYRGHTKSFAYLVKLYGGDVTPKSVRHELERMGLIEATPGGKLRPCATRKRRNIEAYRLSDLARSFEDFAFAILGPKLNSEAPSSFFGFKDFTVPSTSDAAFFMSRFSRRAAALLENFQDWSAGRTSSHFASQEKAARVALGVYLLRCDKSFAPNRGMTVASERPPGPSSKRHS